MSLYRHVPNKDALLEQMADLVFGERLSPNPGGRWQDEMAAFWTAFHDLLLEHPAIAYVLVDIPLAGSELALRGEEVLATLLRGGLDDASAAEALIGLTWYTVGGALYSIGRSDPKQTSSRGEARTATAGAVPVGVPRGPALDLRHDQGLLRQRPRTPDPRLRATLTPSVRCLTVRVRYAHGPHPPS